MGDELKISHAGETAQKATKIITEVLDDGGGRTTDP